MIQSTYDHLLAELLTPELSQTDFEGAVEKFGKRFMDYHNSGFGISIPDNPMGNLRFTSTEVLEFLELSIERVIVHINSFHRKEDFDQIVQGADALGVQNLLLISGDGNPKLHRMEPEELGFEPTAVGAATSVELLKYIKREYPGRFKFGVAFNQYEHPDTELLKMEKKAEAGFDFIGTQLYLPTGMVEGFEHRTPLSELEKYGKPVDFGIWCPSHKPDDESMKTVQRIDLLLDCISPYYEPSVVIALKEKLLNDGYDAFSMVEHVKEEFGSKFPSLSFYFSLPVRKKMEQWRELI